MKIHGDPFSKNTPFFLNPWTIANYKKNTYILHGNEDKHGFFEAIFLSTLTLYGWITCKKKGYQKSTSRTRGTVCLFFHTHCTIVNCFFLLFPCMHSNEIVESVYGLNDRAEKLHPSLTTLPFVMLWWWLQKVRWIIKMIFEPTCAICTVGSYPSLSVCLSVRPSGLYQKSLENNSYLRKYLS